MKFHELFFPVWQSLLFASVRHKRENNFEYSSVRDTIKGTDSEHSRSRASTLKHPTRRAIMKFEEFKRQTVFITGAASGIGYAQATLFLENGANVALFDQQELGLKKLKELFPSQVVYTVGSVKNQRDVQLAVEKTQTEFKRIDILCNTAGVLDGFKTTLETDEVLWDHIFDTNVKGTYFVTKAVLPSMVEKQQGIIINMASIAGLISGGGGVAYTASKHAIVGFTKQLSYDYIKQGIRVNAIAPGAIQTPMNAADFKGDGEMAKWVAKETPAGRWADPKEVAQLTLFIASATASYMHGNIIQLDGGWMNKG